MENGALPPWKSQVLFVKPSHCFIRIRWTGHHAGIHWVYINHWTRQHFQHYKSETYKSVEQIIKTDILLSDKTVSPPPPKKKPTIFWTQTLGYTYSYPIYLYTNTILVYTICFCYHIDNTTRYSTPLPISKYFEKRVTRYNTTSSFLPNNLLTIIHCFFL